MLRILLDHLISTIKFTRDGGKITFRLSLPKDDWLTIKVADTGVGIEPYQRDLFLRNFTGAVRRGCTRPDDRKDQIYGRRPWAGIIPGARYHRTPWRLLWVEDNYDSAGQPLGSKFIAQLPRGDVVESAALITVPLYLPVRV